MASAFDKMPPHISHELKAGAWPDFVLRIIERHPWKSRRAKRKALVLHGLALRREQHAWMHPNRDERLHGRWAREQLRKEAALVELAARQVLEAEKLCVVCEHPRHRHMGCGEARGPGSPHWECCDEDGCSCDNFRGVMKYVIKGPNGTYFDRWTGIGPKFGATKEEAYRYDSRQDAWRATADWRFFDCEVEEVPQ